MSPAAKQTVLIPTPVLRVTGTGRVEVVPDSVSIDIGVILEGDELETVQQQSAAKMAKIRQTISESGIADQDVKTRRYTINEQRDYKKNKRLGYQVSNIVSVKVREMARTGELIDAVTVAGANSIGSLVPEVTDPSVAEGEARQRAVPQAMSRAKVLAKSAGVKTGRIVAIIDSPVEIGHRPPTRMMAMASMDSGAPTSIDAGTEEITATVAMEFEIVQ